MKFFIFRFTNNKKKKLYIKYTIIQITLERTKQSINYLETFCILFFSCILQMILIFYTFSFQIGEYFFLH